MRRLDRLNRGHWADGFTLVEVLVVIAVIGIIVGLVIPALSSVHAEAHSTLCLSNLRQLYTAVDTARQQRKDMFPYAAPLPVPAGQFALVPGLPETLKGIITSDNPVWMCPADQTDDSEAIGTSYAYIPGAFMLLEPPLLPEPPSLPMTPYANAQRVARLITERWSNGYLHPLPLIADSGDYHVSGNRKPRNAVFIDGNARVIKPIDSNVQPPPPP